MVVMLMNNFIFWPVSRDVFMGGGSHEEHLSPRKTQGESKLWAAEQRNKAYRPEKPSGNANCGCQSDETRPTAPKNEIAADRWKTANKTERR